MAIVLIYRPPNSNVKQFCQALHNTLVKVAAEYKHICLLGDFNLPQLQAIRLNDTSGASNPELLDITCSFSLTQINSIAWNVHNNILDLVFTNSPESFSSISKLDGVFSTDHAVLSFCKYSAAQSQASVKREALNFKLADFDKLRSILNSLPLIDAIRNSPSVDDAWKSWAELLTQAVNECIPKYTLSQRKTHPPWVNSEIRHLNNQN